MPNPQRKVLDAIHTYWLDNVEAPSLRDLAEATGLGVTTVVYYVGKLKAAGHIVASGNHRSIKPVGMEVSIPEPEEGEA